MGEFGFWLFVAAMVVAGIWSDTRKKAEAHETLRTIVDKTGTVDEAQLRHLVLEHSGAEKPGYAYRGLRVIGMIVMALGAGIATAVLVLMTLSNLFAVKVILDGAHQGIPIIAIATGVAVLGLGIFLSSRFATPPVDTPNGPPAR